VRELLAVGFDPNLVSTLDPFVGGSSFSGVLLMFSCRGDDVGVVCVFFFSFFLCWYDLFLLFVWFVCLAACWCLVSGVGLLYNGFTLVGGVLVCCYAGCVGGLALSR
jgi:hypothetical protein